MFKSLYLHLALQNIKKHYRTTIPYMLTCIITVMMFSVLLSLSKSTLVLGGNGAVVVESILSFGVVVVGFFSLLFIFYTSSFLLKKRLKEFGVYNVLGLEKKHIALVTSIECILTSSVSIVVGLLSSFVFCKVAQLLLFRITRTDAIKEFTMSLDSVVITCVLFIGIFTLVLLYTLWIVSRSKPIELIQSESAGEKQPKSNWVVAILGFVSLGVAYWMAQNAVDPLEAIFTFFLAVILVIIGTFCLFISGSVVVLKALKKNENFYYKTKNFTAVSGMIYRMKKNAAGLANICILSTCIVVMLSTTTSLYFSMENLLRTRYHSDISVTIRDITNEQQREEANQIIENVVNAKNVIPQNVVQYRSALISMVDDGDTYKKEVDRVNNIMYVIPLSEYNKLVDDTISLGHDEVIIIDEGAETQRETIQFNGFEYKVMDAGKAENQLGSLSHYVFEAFYLITPDFDGFLSQFEAEEFVSESYFYGFDLDEPATVEMDVANQIYQEIKNSGTISGTVEGLENGRADFYQLYGSFLFIGLFLGTLFIMVTILIIYYKQISEGYEDVRRFDIMRKVGMSQSEVKSSIKRQVLMVFFIPIIMAIIHVVFSFKMVIIIMKMLNLIDVNMLMICTGGTILVFVVIYGIIYMITSRIYNNIVNQKKVQ